MFSSRFQVLDLHTQAVVQLSCLIQHSSIRVDSNHLASSGGEPSCQTSRSGPEVNNCLSFYAYAKGDQSLKYRTRKSTSEFEIVLGRITEACRRYR